VQSRGADLNLGGCRRRRLAVAAALIVGAMPTATAAAAPSARRLEIRRTDSFAYVAPSRPVRLPATHAARSAAAAASAAEISTFAGSVAPGPVPATSIGMYPAGVAAGGGNLFVSDPAFNVAREINSKGIQTVVAGDGGWGAETGDGGVATSAGLSNPAGMALDAKGDLFIADSLNARVRVVAASSCASSCPYGLASTTAHHIYTVAGGGSTGVGDGGPATATELGRPTALTVDSRGDLVIADAGEDRIRLVAATSCASSCPYGLTSMTGGHIYTVAGNGQPGYFGDGGLATAARINNPNGLATDAKGDLFITDTSNNRIRFVAASTCSSSCPYGLAATIAHHIYTVAGTGFSGYSGDGGRATMAQVSYPGGVAADAKGDLLIADTDNSVIRLVASGSCSSSCPYGLARTTPGDIYTVSGAGRPLENGVPANDTMLGFPSDVAIDSGGNLLIADTDNLFVRVVAASSCSSSCPYGLTSTTAGYIYLVGGDYSEGYGGDGGPAASAEMSFPAGVGYDASGDLLISDTVDNRVRMVAASSCSASCPYGLSATVAGDIYTVAGNGAIGYRQDAVPATSTSVWQPEGVAFDSRGDLLMADSTNSRIRLVARTSCASSCPYGLTSMTAGYIYTVAGNGNISSSGDGGPATAAALYFPEGVAVDAKGDVLIADTGNDRVRIVAGATCSSSCPYGLKSMTAGDIYTVAGNGTGGFSGDGGPATAAALLAPSGVGLDTRHNLVIADAGNNRVRIVAGASCSSSCGYGLKSVTAGHIYTVAGNGSPTDAGDGGLATAASLPLDTDPLFPSSVAVDAKGDLLISTGNLFVTGSSRVRMVAASTCSSACPYGLAHTTANDIYTVAGGGTAGLGDGGSPTTAMLAFPSGVAVNSSGDLAIADAKQNRIRIVAVPPRNTAVPVISGSAHVGGKLTTTPGTWAAPSAISYRYQWLRCSSTGTGCTSIAGATASAYVPTSADVGHRVSVQVSATDREGQTGQALARTVGPASS
jgi:hypothetical protein